MSRARETWSCHDKRHPESPGSPFGSTHGSAPRKSCPLCSRHMLPRETEAMPQMRGQRRCVDRVACAAARGGQA